MRVTDLDRAVRMRKLREIVSAGGSLSIHIKSAEGSLDVLEPGLLQKVRLMLREYADAELDKMGVKL